MCFVFVPYETCIDKETLFVTTARQVLGYRQKKMIIFSFQSDVTQNGNALVHISGYHLQDDVSLIWLAFCNN